MNFVHSIGRKLLVDRRIFLVSGFVQTALVKLVQLVAQGIAFAGPIVRGRRRLIDRHRGVRVGAGIVVLGRALAAAGNRDHANCGPDSHRELHRTFLFFRDE